MLIRLGYDLRFDLPAPTAMVALLHVHPSRDRDLREPDALQTEPKLPVAEYIDSFGNRCSRIFAPAGALRLHGSTLIVGADELDEMDANAEEMPVQDLPHEVLKFLLNSRYCEVDRLSAIALDLFGGMPRGMVAGPGHRCVCASHHSIQLHGGAVDQDGPRRFYRAHRCLPRFPTPGDYTLPRTEYTGSLCDRIPGGFRASSSRHLPWISAPGLRCISAAAGGPWMHVIIASDWDEC